MVVNSKSVLVIIAVICFALGALAGLGAITTTKVDWTDLGLFFGFLSFLV